MGELDGRLGEIWREKFLTETRPICHWHKYTSTIRIQYCFFQNGTVDRELFYQLWTEYFISTDPAAKGNFLFGDV